MPSKRLALPIGFDQIDWTAPWYDRVRREIDALRGGANWRDTLTELAAERQITTGAGRPIHFVAPEVLSADTAYEAEIFATGQVATRNHLHDLFNALIWLQFPALKRVLNQLQAQHIAQHGVGSTRGRLRDTATLFDENAALLWVQDSPLGRQWVSALRQHQWQLLQTPPEQFKQVITVELFGHALLEKLARPYKAITAHAVVVYVPDWLPAVRSSRQEWREQQLVQQLAAMATATIPDMAFTPLPVLGIPGWWPDQDAAFYADSSVFRPARRPGATK